MRARRMKCSRGLPPIFLIFIGCLLLTGCEGDLPEDSKKSQGKSSGMHREPVPQNRKQWGQLTPDDAEIAHGRFLRSAQKSPPGEFAELLPEELAALRTEFSSATMERKLEILERLASIPGEEADAVFLEAGGDPSPEVRIVALEILASRSDASVDAGLLRAFADPEDSVRAAAVSLLDASSPQKLWQAAVEDPAPGVRFLAWTAMEVAPQSVRFSTALTALQSRDPTQRKEAVHLLGGVFSREAVEALIPLIDDPEAGDLASDGLRFLLSREFFDSDSAAAWWKENQKDFDETLAPAPSSAIP